MNQMVLDRSPRSDTLKPSLPPAGVAALYSCGPRFFISGRGSRFILRKDCSSGGNFPGLFRKSAHQQQVPTGGARLAMTGDVSKVSGAPCSRHGFAGLSILVG